MINNIVDLLYSLQNDLENLSFDEFLLITKLIQNKIDNKSQKINYSREINDKTIEELYNIYENIKQFWNDNHELLNKLNNNKIFKFCNLSSIQDIENKLQYIYDNKYSITHNDINEVYSCLNNILNSMKDEVTNNSKIKIPKDSKSVETITPPEDHKKKTEAVKTIIFPENAEKQELQAKQAKTKQPETKQPETKQPETKQPETKQPETKQPEAKQPETKQPEAKQPEAKQPEAKQAKQARKDPEEQARQARKDVGEQARQAKAKAEAEAEQARQAKAKVEAEQAEQARQAKAKVEAEQAEQARQAKAKVEAEQARQAKAKVEAEQARQAKAKAEAEQAQQDAEMNTVVLANTSIRIPPIIFYI